MGLEEKLIKCKCRHENERLGCGELEVVAVMRERERDDNLMCGMRIGDFRVIQIGLELISSSMSPSKSGVISRHCHFI
jgi:hypothetical protein